MNRIVIISFLFCMTSLLTAQEWKQSERMQGDTLVLTETYVDDDEKGIEDLTNTHKIITEYKHYYLLNSKRFDLNGNPSEDKRGVHHQKIFLKKFFKFYDKNGQSLRLVKDTYEHEESDATYCIYKYNEHSDLLEVQFFKDEITKDKQTGILTRHQRNAVEKYKGMVQKYQYKYSRNRKTIKEYTYNVKGEFIEMRILKRKRKKKKKK